MKRSKTIIAAICRTLLGVVFVFSGAVKAIDPFGTVYKIEDYLKAFGGFFTELLPLAEVAAVVLILLEVVLGVCMVLNVRTQWTSWLALAFYAMMTPLTLYIAINNPVSDCGCFGDALVLTNWQTFGKNVVLLIMSLVLLRWRRHIFPLVTGHMDWLIAIYGFLYILGMQVYSYRDLPVFDFRPYYAGADIRLGMTIPEGEKPTIVETRFILQKDGVEKEFTLDNYPDSTWTFVDSRTVVKEKGYEPPIQDFSIIRYDDGEDITEQVLSDSNYTFLLVAHQLSLADDSKMDLINELYEYSLEYGYAFYCLTSSEDKDILAWQENTGAEYPFCLMDNIILKTMIRSNPGLMLLKDGRVIRKWSVQQFPDEYQLTDALDKLPLGYTDDRTMTDRLIWILAWFVIPLVICCMSDLLWERYRIRRQKIEKE